MKYECPLCKSELEGMAGEKQHPGDVKYGYSLYCVNVKCGAQEVMGHGDKEKDAYEVIRTKFIDPAVRAENKKKKE